MEKVSIFWFRRDLRIEDNAGLYNALKSKSPVLPIFIFDKEILDNLENKSDRRVEFIYLALQQIHKELLDVGSSLLIMHGNPKEIFKQLMGQYTIDEVFTNKDYEPYAIKRDLEIQSLLAASGIAFKSYKDQVIFEKDEILKDNKVPYTVYSPYSKKWKAKCSDFYLKSYPTSKYFNNFFKTQPLLFLDLNSLGFNATGGSFPPKIVLDSLISNYAQTRNFPGVEGTSRLSVHLRFGTISIRHLAQQAIQFEETYLNELIWREFFMMIFYHFPQAEHHTFKPEYEKIKWRNNEEEFEKWCLGNTGYPIVDAGMRELNNTGYMHNRVRLVVASFLCKHLLIDWRWGESYFAKKLLDFDQAANNGNWQWAAGSGCDAAPYFRVFNPYLQALKFDKALSYIKKWVPEFQELNYPQPIVDHDFARKRALEVYKAGLSERGLS